MPMQRITLFAFCMVLVVISVAHGSPAHRTGVEVADSFSISGIKVDATAKSPREARDLAIARGRALAWSTLFRRITNQQISGTEPRLGENELIGLVLRTEADNERRNTTRYVADVTFHFNRAAVLRVLSRSNIHTVEDESIDPQAPEIADSRTYLAVNVRFDNGADWAILRARLSATDGVAGIDVVGRTAHDAQIYLSYSDDVEQLRSALAQSALQLTNSDGGYTLQLGSASATIASLGAPSRPTRD